MKKKAIISACLIGVNCKYNGGNNLLPKEKLNRLMDEYELIPVCPEAYGGLPTPRIPSERKGDKVLTKDMRDVTDNFARGAEIALYLAEVFDAELAILKENSPSCGSGTVYDGTFSNTLTEGDGVTAELFKKKGIRIIGESQI